MDIVPIYTYPPLIISIFQLDVKMFSDNVDLKNYVSNGEWELLKVTLIDDVSFYAISPEPYPFVKATFK